MTTEMAFKSVFQLTNDLAFSEQNKSYGSQLGGNAKELLVLLSNDTVNVHTSADVERPTFHRTDGQLSLSVRENTTLAAVREALTEFVNANPSETKEVTFKDLADTEKVISLGITTNKMKSFVETVKTVQALSNSLSTKSSKADLTDDDKSLLNTINQKPYYEGVVSFREIVGVSNMMKFDLDEFLTNLLSKKNWDLDS